MYCRCLAPQISTRTLEVIDVGRWFKGELDAIAQALNWTLLPPNFWAETTLRFRSAAISELPVLELDRIGRQLQAEGLVIPDCARGAYQDLRLAQAALRLYVLTWWVSQAEWTLLVILGTQQTEALPMGLTLQVHAQSTASSPEQSILQVQQVTPGTAPLYLYSRVIGTPAEQFQVTVQMAPGVTVTLPPLGWLSQEYP